eukprot:2179830-Pleurochrysis_carterae.AAC.1
MDASGRRPALLASRASSTRRGRSSLAGASTQSASEVMSTLSRSETGPSSSTFHREARSVVKKA